MVAGRPPRLPSGGGCKPFIRGPAKDMDLPGLKSHQLTGKRADIWSVTVSGNWRVTFRFNDGDAEVVNYEDYH